ncbi:PREDICTED: vacuolar amino acid transporter 1 isoform X2 [Ipomoea nil]|uniref:vacuolar amino acid transporter 1 isoform X2 n=1 Tax=Ipomoea nil TaxID=35883 RepID=UPI0009019A59|nr:PREDICTED: vacuolar amino acid transporter 1 isoform X2 [Ipomoea nil]
MEPKFDDGHSITVNLLDGHKKLHQNPASGQTSFSKTCFNGINALSGVGILSVPYALACGGWLSLFFLLIIAASTFYTGLLIQRCMVMDCRIKSYPDIGERAFGSVGRTVVSIVMNLELYMVATGFLILEGDNLDYLIPNLKLELWGIVIGGKPSLVILIGLLILPTVLLNDMSVLSYISASGVIASVTLLGSMLWASATDGIGIHADDALVYWKGIPTAVSLYSFCYCAHPVFPTLYTSMENPTQFSKVLILCFLACTISYASMAILGYLMFGPDVLSQVTLNLPTHKISSKVAILTTLINPIAKYALMVKPLVNAMENLSASHCNKKGCSLVIRTSLVISTVIVAVAIPLFAYLMSLVGAFLSITASVILPCLCFLKISGIYRTLGVEMIMVSGIMVMGVAIMVVGTYTSVLEIYGHL